VVIDIKGHASIVQDFFDKLKQQYGCHPKSVFSFWFDGGEHWDKACEILYGDIS
jgi:hypothetical protein